MLAATKTINKHILLAHYCCGPTTMSRTHCLFSSKIENDERCDDDIFHQHFKSIFENDIKQINNTMKCCGLTPLNLSVIQGSNKETLELLKKGADVNVKDKNGRISLHVAAKGYTSPGMIRVIAEYTSDINTKDLDGKAALHWAVSCGNSSATEILLLNGCDIDIEDDDGNTPLHHAFYYCLEMVEILVEHGAKMDLQNKKGESPLHVAVNGHSGNLNCIRLGKAINAMNMLLDNGADLNVLNPAGETPLHLLRHYYRFSDDLHKLYAFLLNNGAKVHLPDVYGSTSLHLAVSDDSKYLNAMLSTESGKIAVNIPGKGGNYPLHTAVKMRNFGAVQLLLDNGAEIDSKNQDHKTALHLASENDGTTGSIFKLLIEKGAQVTCKDKEMKTPLHIATVGKRSSVGVKEVCTSLLAMGASPNVQDIYGMTPLHNAVEHTTTEVVMRLLENGAEVNTKNNRGETPLRYVCSVDTLELLLENGAMVNEQDYYGRTVLHNIARDFKKSLVKRKLPFVFRVRTMNTCSKLGMLLDWGASQDILDNFGKRPFEYYSFPEVEKEYEIKKGCLFLSENIVNIAQNCYELERLQKLLDNCRKEVAKFKIERFGNNSLYDIFQKYNDPIFLSNAELESAVLSKDLEIRFPIYNCLIVSTYQRARERVYLFDCVARALDTPLPVEVVRYILTFVDNDSMRNVLKAKELSEKRFDTETDSEPDSDPETYYDSDSEPESFWRYQFGEFSEFSFW